MTTGRKDWDLELFKVLPQVLDAPNSQTANTAILKWITDLGPVEECHPCVHLPDHLALSPDTRWFGDRIRLGSELSSLLQRIYANRIAGQWYVALALPGPKNPEFSHEAGYPEMKTDFGLQLLAVYRFWNVIAYWYPYRELIDSDWDDVLRKYIPQVSLAPSPREYERSVLKLAALIKDSHEFVWATLASLPPEGRCIVPVGLRFIGSDPVVTQVFVDGQDIERGDIIRQIDGVSIFTLLQEWRPWYGQSNEAARLRNIALA